MTIKVPPKVKDAIERVRESGAVNMADRNGVLRELDRLGEFNAYVWVNDYRMHYYRGLNEGYETEEPAEEKQDA